MLSLFADQADRPLGHYIASALVLVIATAALVKLVTPQLDPREPTLVRPRIPLFGHLLGLMTSRGAYFSELYQRTKLPIATLPIVNTKLYVINSAPLQQAAMRARHMDAQSMTVDFIPRLFGVRQATLDRLLGRDGVFPPIMPEMGRVFKSTLSGNNLDQLTLRALGSFSESLNGIGQEGLEVPNLYKWLRGIMSRATSDALWGRENNPYRNDPGVIDAQWDFEANMGPLVLGFMPSIIGRTAHRARLRVKRALEPYYRAEHDQLDAAASQFIRSRSRLLRRYGLPLDELCRNEVAVMLAATTNTVPTLFWYIAQVWVRPGVVTEIRNEVGPMLQIHRGSPSAASWSATRVVAVDVTQLESKCPLLVSCYREAVRLSSQIITFRRVLEDTVIEDGEGASYLLKKGCDVMMPAKVVHRHAETWGADADEFDPRRFLTQPGVPGAAETDRRRRASFVPFGGGKHLCPGRHFAFAENLAVMAALVSGFEVLGLRREKLRMRDSKMGEAAKPARGYEGGPVRIQRRQGWEGVEWKFTC